MIPSLPLRVLTRRARGFLITNEALERQRRSLLLALTYEGARQHIVGREARQLASQLALLILLFRVGARPRQLRRYVASSNRRTYGFREVL
jgi:hypothetical protein